MPINYKEYPKNWKQIRNEILLRAKNKCEFCGIDNYKIKEHINDDSGEVFCTKVVLTIAHLDQTKKNNRRSNLRALCQKCHLSWDKETHKLNRVITQAKKDKTLRCIDFKPIMQDIKKNIKIKTKQKIKSMCKKDSETLLYSDTKIVQLLKSNEYR